MPVLLLGVATLNRSGLRPQVTTARARPFQVSLATEYVLICGVLSVTATMTALFAPDTAAP